jgi:hypothetical protein
MSEDERSGSSMEGSYRVSAISVFPEPDSADLFFSFHLVVLGPFSGSATLQVFPFIQLILLDSLGRVGSPAWHRGEHCV